MKKQYKEVEDKLFHEDMLILEVKANKNALESHLYDVRTNISQYGNYEKYVEPSSVPKILEKIQQEIDWIYGPGQNASIDLYK